MTEAEKAEYRILIIDDDNFLLKMYSAKFKKAGFEVEVAVNAVSALEKIKNGFNPNVLLIDIILPKMTGLEFVEKIKEEKLLPGATLIMLTNQSDQTDIQKAKELKVQGYIVKATTIPSEVVSEVIDIIDNNKKHA